MSSQLSAHKFKKVYEDLGIDTGKLGCIMLDVQPIKVGDTIAEEDLFYADPEEHKWIQGVVSEEVPHITLMYGLLRSGREMQKHVDTVLELVDGGDLPDHIPKMIEIEEVSFFYSNEPSQRYVTLVALITVTDELIELNERLKFLPHLNTFIGYKPHITLAYVKDSCNWQGYIKKLNENYKGATVRTTGINYGD